MLASCQVAVLGIVLVFAVLVFGTVVLLALAERGQTNLSDETDSGGEPFDPQDYEEPEDIGEAF